MNKEQIWADIEQHIRTAEGCTDAQVELVKACFDSGWVHALHYACQCLRKEIQIDHS